MEEARFDSCIGSMATADPGLLNLAGYAMIRTLLNKSHVWSAEAECQEHDHFLLSSPNVSTDKQSVRCELRMDPNVWVFFDKGGMEKTPPPPLRKKDKSPF